MGDGFDPPTVEEVFPSHAYTGHLFTCGCCQALVGYEGLQGHIDWHRRMGDPVMALYHTGVGLRRKGFTE